MRKGSLSLDNLGSASRHYIQVLLKYSRAPLYRNSLFLMANTALTAVLGYVFLIVVARFYDEAEVGWGTATISAIALLALLSRLGLGFALIRFLPRSRNPVEMINSSLTLGGITSVVLAVIFIAGVSFWSPGLAFLREDAVFAVVFVFFTLFTTLSVIAEYIFIARRRASFVLAKSTIFSLLKLALPFLLVIFFRAFGIVSSVGIATGIALAVALLLFMPRVEPGYKPVSRINFGIIRDMWRYSAGNYFTALFSAAPRLILPVMLVSLLGPVQNAYFYVTWMLATLLFVIPRAVAQSLFAEGSHFEDELAANVRRSYKFIFLLLVPAVLVLVFAGRWFLLAFGPEYAANGLALLQILALSGIFVGINNVYYTILRVEGRIRELVAIYGLIALAVLALSYVVTDGAGGVGIVGVGYAWFGAQGLASLYVTWKMRPYLHRHVH